MLTAHTGERRCEDDHGPTRDTIHSQGTGHVSVHHHETEDYTMGQPRQFHYHTTLFHTSRERYSGDPSSVYCPIGTGIPFQVTSGYYTDGGIEASAGTVTGTSFVAHDFTSGACAPAAGQGQCNHIGKACYYIRKVRVQLQLGSKVNKPLRANRSALPTI